jgi:predicted hotdog family 3-hydroxylacyl-ACP dehydratase
MNSGHLPPIEDLLPHRGTMLLLDRAISFDAESACCEYKPRPEAWYADKEGNMPAWIGIELMAQTIAAHVGLLKHSKGLPHKQGVLLGTRRYSASHPAFMANSLLHIHARIILCNTGGLGAYECHIEAENEHVATATLMVFEPDDFKIFMQSSHP